jgi:hypothetical protein
MLASARRREYAPVHSTSNADCVSRLGHPSPRRSLAERRRVRQVCSARSTGRRPNRLLHCRGPAGRRAGSSAGLLAYRAIRDAPSGDRGAPTERCGDRGVRSRVADGHRDPRLASPLGHASRHDRAIADHARYRVFRSLYGGEHASRNEVGNSPTFWSGGVVHHQRTNLPGDAEGHERGASRRPACHHPRRRADGIDGNGDRNAPVARSNPARFAQASDDTRESLGATRRMSVGKASESLRRQGRHEIRRVLVPCMSRLAPP